MATVDYIKPLKLCEGDAPSKPSWPLTIFGRILSDPVTLQTAVGFIVATVIRDVITSFVEDMVMPPVGAAIGQKDFSQLFLVMNHPKYKTVTELVRAGLVAAGEYTSVAEAQDDGIDIYIPIKSISDAERVGVATWNYGQFINTFINMIMTIFTLSFMLWFIARIHHNRYQRACSQKQ